MMSDLDNQIQDCIIKFIKQGLYETADFVLQSNKWNDINKKEILWKAIHRPRQKVEPIAGICFPGVISNAGIILYLEITAENNEEVYFEDEAKSAIESIRKFYQEYYSEYFEKNNQCAKYVKPSIWPIYVNNKERKINGDSLGGAFATLMYYKIKNYKVNKSVGISYRSNNGRAEAVAITESKKNRTISADEFSIDCYTQNNESPKLEILNREKIDIVIFSKQQKNSIQEIIQIKNFKIKNVLFIGDDIETKRIRVRFSTILSQRILILMLVILAIGILGIYVDKCQYDRSKIEYICYKFYNESLMFEDFQCVSKKPSMFYINNFRYTQRVVTGFENSYKVIEIDGKILSVTCDDKNSSESCKYIKILKFEYEKGLIDYYRHKKLKSVEIVTIEGNKYKIDLNDKSVFKNNKFMYRYAYDKEIKNPILYINSIGLKIKNTMNQENQYVLSSNDNRWNIVKIATYSNCNLEFIKPMLLTKDIDMGYYQERLESLDCNKMILVTRKKQNLNFHTEHRILYIRKYNLFLIEDETKSLCEDEEKRKTIKQYLQEKYRNVEWHYEHIVKWSELYIENMINHRLLTDFIDTQLYMALIVI